MLFASATCQRLHAAVIVMLMRERAIAGCAIDITPYARVYAADADARHTMSCQLLL